MARRRAAHDLFVFMNGYRVGCLRQLAGGSLEFSYHREWLDASLRRPISLCMPLSTRAYRGELVYNYFDNLLPDSLAIRNRIQQRFKAKTNRCFDLLSFIGRDCVGALQLSSQEESPNVRRIRSTVLGDREVAQLLRSYRVAPLGMQDDADDFRISLAGVQEKTALLRLRKRWHRPVAGTPTTHIFKLPIGIIEHAGIDLSQSIENEWLCHLILKEFGLAVAAATIESFEEQRVLVVERFDRVWADNQKWVIRLPQEDFCQALKVPPSLKYEADGGPGIVEIMRVLLGSSESMADRSRFLSAQFIFFLLAAIDGHAKNFSIFLQAGGRYHLTPLYDVISAYPLLGKRELETRKIKMAMALLGKSKHYRWSEMLARHWHETAHRCRFPAKAMAVIIEDSLSKMDAVIVRVSKQLVKGFPEQMASSIFAGMRRARERFAKPVR